MNREHQNLVINNLIKVNLHLPITNFKPATCQQMTTAMNACWLVKGGSIGRSLVIREGY